jgi:ferredoxin
MAVNITMETCDRCGTCISVCPVNALMLLTEMLVVDAARCTGCGVCVSVCPFGALVVSPNASSPSKAGADHG